MDTGTIISLGLYFVVMLGIGLFAYRQTDTNVEGYMLGGRQLGPAVTALSAGASDMSGWMLMGLPGAMYVSGLSAGWIAVGLTLGALANYMLVAPDSAFTPKSPITQSHYLTISKTALTIIHDYCELSHRW